MGKLWESTHADIEGCKGGMRNSRSETGRGTRAGGEGAAKRILPLGTSVEPPFGAMKRVRGVPN